ncbi:MAG: ATP-binding protein [Thermodesulfovibrio sp.]|nr:ATP-binding protein [Thermodesulfovibrio sp.]MDW7972965.1 ATP-binding protein [Thermodesulfovibrio sp.]
MSQGIVCTEGCFIKCKNFFCEHGQKLSELLHLCSNVIEKISKGDTRQKIDIKVERYSLQRLIDSINRLSREIEDLINLNHELAIGICEHFDVLRRLQEGDFSAKASEDSPIEIVKMLGELINKLRDRFIDYIDKIKEQHREMVKIYEQERVILSSIGVAILITEEDMTVEFVNEEFERLTGYTKKEVEGKMKWSDFISEDVLDKVVEYHKLRRISPSLAPNQFEIKIKDKSGNIKDALITVAMIPYTKKSIKSIIDITERKKIQEQLLHSQKMEALGVLSGRIAHEYKNILTGVLGFASILNNKIQDENLKKYVQRIVEAGERAKELSNTLLAFSRKEEISVTTKVSLNKFLVHYSDFIKSIIGKDIELKLNLPETEVLYEIEPTHLEVILLNLITNARDAMPEGGEVILSLNEIYLNMDYQYTHPLVKPGDYVVLSVSDTGVGMDEETKQRIFEPFFTTKPKGKGTGLGLSTVYGLVKRYNGHIHVYSELGKGTTFKIYLPQKIKKSINSIDKEKLKGSETLLIVDDDAHVRQYLASFFKEYGYQVYEAENGEKAVEIFKENKDKINLCLVDFVMPKMSGIEVKKVINSINPNTKVAIMSGNPVNLKDFITIEKSISPEEILFKVRTILDEKE